MDSLTVLGHGSSPRVLEDAEIAKADLLVAVTNQDEVNILAGIYAHQAGVKNVVVRVTNPDYLLEHPSFCNLNALGIDLGISQEGECALELANVIQLPGSAEVVHMLDERVQAVGMKVHYDSPLIRQPLSEFPRPDLLEHIRFIGVMRGTDLFIPRGDTQFMIGDLVYFVGKPKDTLNMLDYADPEHIRIERVVISGGNDLGLHLAQRLESKERDLVLLEPNPDRAEYCSTHLNRTLVIKGDALSQEHLEEVGINNRTAFVAATNNDEDNIISCLLAENMGAAMTISQITKMDYVPIINNSSLLDRAVSPHTAMSNAILRYIRGHHVESAALLQSVPGELLELTLKENSLGIGQKILDIRLPKDAILAVLVRDDNIIIATGENTLQVGDRLLVFAKQTVADKVESIFNP
jgi:trk system potassium uptake protein TrkA